MSHRGESLIAAIAGERRPCAVVDLDAFDANLDRLLEPLGERSLRVASKSLRIPALIGRVLEHPGAVGVLCYHAEEARLLVEQGFDDLLIAYPGSPEDAAVVAELVRGGARIYATVDAPVQVEALADAARRAGVVADLCLDIDLSLRLGGVHIGVRRSPIRTVDQAVELAQFIQQTHGVQLRAVLAYEAQVAGVPDHTGGVVDLPMRWVKRRSRSLALARRAEIVVALRELGCRVEVVNGGGTGSIDFTATDPACTEVSAGSGLLCPHLFDGYSGLNLQPAAFFALGVVRSSDPGFVTCFGGGYSASGAAGPDRLPKPWWPEVGMVGLEGFGEVQTPFSIKNMDYGDTILCRHAKSGELAEHFSEVLLVSGSEVVDRVPTYRGLGSRFG